MQVLNGILISFLLGAGGVPFSANAQTVSASPTPTPVYAPPSLMQSGGDETIIDRKKHTVTLTGNAFVYRDKEALKADLIRLNTVTKFVHAEGRIQYQYGDYFVRADAMDIDLQTKTGTIINGNISNGHFALRGSRIDQVEPNHFKVKNYDYTTCYDCPNAWEITGKDVDMTVEGYAYINDFAFKVKDAPFFWLPYMVVPIKTKRQSGFLFPKFGKSADYGFWFVEPFYWAINKYSDMTLGIGDYTERGARFEIEGRYALTPRSQGTANFYWTHDTEVSPLYYRWAAKTAISQELPFGFEGKLHMNEVSDSGYPIRYGNDIDGRYNPFLSSDLFFSNNDPDISTSISFRRIRNLLLYDGPNPVAKFDPLTVQEFPRITLSTNDRFIFGQKFAAGIETRFNRFARQSDQNFDVFTNSDGTQTALIRKATRFTAIPGVYTTLNPWPWLSVVPSAQYRAYLYNFSGAISPTGDDYKNLVRGYLLGQIETSLQVEKVIKTADPGVTYRHTIRPSLTYSNIPNFAVIQSSEHPFIKQVQSQARPGQYFDDSDIVPQSTTQNLDSYFTPLGNSLTYGLTTQLFRKETTPAGGVQVSRRAEAGLSQTWDLYIQNADQRKLNSNGRIPLSPLFTHFLYSDNKFTANLEYTYYSDLDQYNKANAQLLPNTSPHRLSASLSWTLDHHVKDNLLQFERSFALTYGFAKLTSKVSSLTASSSFSINDYLMPRGALSYNLVSDASPKILEIRGSVLIQNPSKCWQTELGLRHSVDQNSGIIFNIALNVSGDTFEGQDSLKK